MKLSQVFPVLLAVVYLALSAHAQFDPSLAVVQNAAMSDPAPTISSISPVSGTSNGGKLITINGTNFLSGATASIGGLALTGVTVVSSSKITGTTQAHVAGFADVVVTNTDNQSGI